MSPQPADPWRPARVRFMDGSRAQQTPTAVYWRDKWLDVRLVGESLVQNMEPGDQPERRFVLVAPDGDRFLLRGRAPGPWRIKAG